MSFSIIPLRAVQTDPSSISKVWPTTSSICSIRLTAAGTWNFSGCGNTINCNHPMVTRFIVNRLEWWVEQLGVDGFRFDLASAFVRAEDGSALSKPPLPWNIELLRTLARLPLIAEAWDAGGLYQVGAFPGLSWTEWNGRYRDVIR